MHQHLAYYASKAAPNSPQRGAPNNFTSSVPCVSSTTSRPPNPTTRSRRTDLHEGAYIARILCGDGFHPVRSYRRMSFDGVPPRRMYFFDNLLDDPMFAGDYFTFLHDYQMLYANHPTSLDANLTCLEDDSSPEHHHGPTSTPSTLYGTAQGTPVADNQVNDSALCPSIPCLHPRPDGTACPKEITCCDVPEHFKKVHGIKKLGRDHPLICGWGGCNRRLSRHNFVRHVREKHFKLDRKSAHKCAV